MTDTNAPIQWTQALSVGIDVIDEDHKTFFTMANILLSAIRDNPPELNTIIQSSLSILLEYVDGHFLREERAMEKAAWPDLEQHQKLHADFRSQVIQLASDYNAGRGEAAKELADLVNKWTAEHIAQVDKLYQAYIRLEHVDARPLAFLSFEAEGDDGQEDFGLLGNLPASGVS
jgi:hemerythrin